MENGNKILLAVLGGAAVGLASGILFAPAKGSETRKALADKANNAKDAVLEKKDELSEKLSGFKNSFEEKKESMKKDIRAELIAEIEKLEAKLKNA